MVKAYNLFSATINYSELASSGGVSVGRAGATAKDRVHKLRNAPSLVSEPQRLRWRRAQGFMGAAEIIVSNVQRDRRNVVVQLL